MPKQEFLNVLNTTTKNLSALLVAWIQATINALDSKVQELVDSESSDKIW